MSADTGPIFQLYVVWNQFRADGYRECDHEASFATLEAAMAYPDVGLLVDPAQLAGRWRRIAKWGNHGRWIVLVKREHRITGGYVFAYVIDQDRLL